MKKRYKLLTLFSFVALALTGCGKGSLPFDQGSGEIDEPWKDFTYPITSLDFDESEEHIDLPINTTHEYSYEYEPLDAKTSQLTWESSNNEIASVSDGVVTGNSVGSAIISVGSTEKVEWENKKLYVNVVIPITDFLVGDQTMDLESTLTLQPTFIPENTSYKNIEYTVLEDDLISISNGVVTSFNKEGVAHVSATCAQLPEVSKDFTITVKTVRVQSLALSVNASELELNKTTFARVSVNPEEAVNYHDYKTYGIRFETSTPDIIDVTEQGDITAKKEGTGKLVAKCGDVASNEVEIQIFEVKASAITITDENGEPIVTEVDLNNTTDSTIKLGYTYTTDHAGKSRPTRANPVFASGDSNVVTIDETGLVTVVGKGQTRITITDSNYGVSDYIDINVTIYCTALTIIYDMSETRVGGTINLGVASVPATGITSSNVTYSLDEGDEAVAELVQTGKTATLKGIDAGTVTVTATWDSCTDTKQFTFAYDDTFYDGIPYVVGSAAFNTGRSVPVEGGSWNLAHLANEMSEEVVDPTVLFQRKTTINFAQGDEWKIRFGEEWMDVQDKEPDYDLISGEYVIDKEDSAISWGNENAMTVTEGENRNIKVLVAGSYDIYYKIYDRTLEGKDPWWSIYVMKTPVFSINPNEVSLDKGQTTTVNAEHYDLTYEITEYDDTLIDVSTEGNVITITAKDDAEYGSKTTIVAEDNLGVTATCKVSITEKFIANQAYVVGSADYHDGKSTTSIDGSWNIPSQALKMESVTPPESIENPVIKQFLGRIEFNENDIWKIRVGDVYKTEHDKDGGYEPVDYGCLIDGEHMVMLGEDENYNIKVLIAGSYDIYYKEYQNNTWSVWVTKSPVIALDKTSVTLDVGEFTIVSVTNAVGAITVGDYDDEKISVTPSEGENKYKVEALSYTTSPINVTFTDETEKTATLKVTVAKAFETTKIYAVGSKDYSSGVSTDNGASWDDANRAYVLEMHDDGKPVGCIHQYKAVIKFAAGDEWKLRTGVTGSEDPYYAITSYEAAGCFANGKMEIKNNNVYVNEAVTADIYIKFFDENQYSIYVGDAATVSFEKSTVNLQCNEEIGIKVNNAIGQVTYTVEPTGVVTLDEVACSSTLCKFKAGTVEGECTITATDSYGNTSTLEVKVSEAPVTIVKVTFIINYGTDMGQGVYLINEEEHGWDCTKGIRGTWTDGNNWKFEIEREAGTTWTFKFVINDYDTPASQAIRWEADPNRTYTFTVSETVTCNWQA